jgi:hypothetical protein
MAGAAGRKSGRTGFFSTGKAEQKFRDDLACVYPPTGKTVAQGENDETIGYAVPGGRNAAGFPGKRRYEL